MTKDGRVGLRLSEADREAFMEKYDSIRFKNYGANIKENVEVPDALKVSELLQVTTTP